MALLSKFFGRTASEGAAFALGLATGPVLQPEVQELVNKTWELNPSRRLEAGDAAEIVAEDVEQRDWGAGEASAHGVDGGRFDALVGAVLNAPGFADLLTLRRRGLISPARFEHGLRKARLETIWDESLAGLEDVLLSVADLANAVVQGHMTQDAAAAEAALQGVTAPRFDVLVQNTGLPPGPETGLEWLRRGILSDAEFGDLVREGHTKVKYIPKYLQALSPVLSHATYAGLRLRGWLTKAESDAGGALTGYTPEQMQLEFLNRGRPATAHQIHIGYARGGSVPGAANEVDAIEQAIKRSDIRPEYSDVIVAGRYTLPSWFALRALLTGGAITEAQAATLLKQSGWPPNLADEVAAFYAHPTQTTGTVNPRVKRAQDQVYNAAHGSYLNNEIDRPRAIATLERIGVTAAVAGQVVDLWDVENDVLIKPLTAAQIKKAYSENTFTIDDAAARLVDQQWSAADARIYLQS